MTRYVWTVEDIAWLEDNAASVSLRQASEHLGCPMSEVQAQVRFMGLTLRVEVTPAWSDERIARLRALWADGFSASQISKQLGDITRNAVIGKASRLGLERSLQTKAAIHHAETARAVAERVRREALERRKAERLQEAQAIRAAVHRSAAVVPRVSTTALEPDGLLAVGFLDLNSRRQCGWPLAGEDRWCGEPKDGQFCTHHKVKGVNHHAKPFRGFSDGGRGPRQSRAPRPDNLALRAWGRDW